MNKNIDPRVRDAAARLRKIREMKGLTREKFCELLGENSEYWGLIERGEQAISLVKLLQVCEVYGIPIESVIQLNYAEENDEQLRMRIGELLQQCHGRQLEVVKKFIQDIALSL
ncbi:MAG: helix-turn-helix transcriptional regulator [Fournierella sp.]|uniref:helix-turn-helix domain-containing protein n=1 Tax=Allofournierella sp. TaxID=1940256 RepID=UPI002A840EB9|nr:helix-turn-helix transcriptional regulator [Fournierella sp.]MDY4168227.1 helix-turn-helix transcriptional regulator [Fournierella sp.]